MNRMLGTKWFTFYTKIRPVFAVLFAIASIMDFIQYTSVYFDYWWLLLYFLMVVVQIVLCILVVIKSGEDYADFVRFVKGVLLFEVFNIAYQQGVHIYLKSMNFATAFILAGIILMICYFTWYKLNMRYFKKRLLSNISIILPAQEADSSVVKKQEITIMTIPRIQYCRHCGAKISGGSSFCNICESRIVEESEKE